MSTILEAISQIDSDLFRAFYRLTLGGDLFLALLEDSPQGAWAVNSIIEQQLEIIEGKYDPELIKQHMQSLGRNDENVAS